MTGSAIATTLAAGWPAMISLARFGPVSTPAGWPGRSSPITCVIRSCVSCSRPLVRLTTGTREAFVIAQLSDLHCGSAYFDGPLLETAVNETIAVQPDLVLIGGDLTAEGYANEFRTAQHYLEPLVDAGLTTLVLPGNHDA